MSEPLVLCYHAVSQDWPAPLSVTREALEGQLRLLLRRGYRGATLADVALGRATGKVLAVTFDDAFRSVLTLGRPILQRLGLVGSVYAPTDFIGASGPMTWPGIDRWLETPHRNELKPLSWSELGELAEAGWEVGSHTRSHPRLTTLNDSALAEQLTASKAACERALGRPCATLAYPYGDYDDRVVAAARAAGYNAATTLPERLHASAPLTWPRIGVYHADTELRFRLKVAVPLRRLRRTGAWSAVGRVRRRGALRHIVANRSDDSGESQRYPNRL